MRKLSIFIFILIFFTACEQRNASAQSSFSNRSSQGESSSSPSPTIFRLEEANQTRTVKCSPPDRVEIDGSTKELTLIMLFTSWCPSCKAEIPELEKLQKEFGEKLEIIGIQLDDEKRVETSFFISHNYQTNREIARCIYQMVHAPASQPIPLLLLLKGGKYVIHYIGALPIEMLEIDIKRALGE
ncbi:MAG: TlpA family protein disulfide reductase [Epsilonproteobacteria bacterium]|nr:hypothetical protein [Campylobacterota bacterium]NPA57105.1 TlpA family protein disulfide reductase [Campylobacterota bacterium]